ncbi:MAG: ferrochelatase [Acidobacteriota bacterium]|nr:ferrochelatase [Acidobacteriota bacterium]
MAAMPSQVAGLQSRSGSTRFDAVLVVSFGGPQGLADIRPFLANVLRGRRVSPGRVEEVARHYEHFGGVSPITELTRRQAEGLRERLAAAGHPLPVYVGMRNWHPLLVDTLREMSAAGHRRAIGFITAAQHSFSSCEQYRRNVADARAVLRAEGRTDVEVTFVDSWFDHDGFVAVNAAHVTEALARLPEASRRQARLIFTAHSIPLPMAEAGRYREQLRVGAALVAERAGVRDWALVYQSRSGRPEDPWLGPDICDYLREERPKGLRAAVICPIGFVSDHVEVLWDLDREAAAVCREAGIEMARAETANADPRFIDMMADMVLRTIRRHARSRALPIVGLPGSTRGGDGRPPTGAAAS